MTPGRTFWKAISKHFHESPTHQLAFQWTPTAECLLYVVEFLSWWPFLAVLHLPLPLPLIPSCSFSSLDSRSCHHLTRVLLDPIACQVALQLFRGTPVPYTHRLLAVLLILPPFLSKRYYALPFTGSFVICRNLILVTLVGFYFPGYFWADFWPTVSYKVSRFLPNIIIKCFLCEILSFSMYLDEGNRKTTWVFI